MIRTIIPLILSCVTAHLFALTAQDRPNIIFILTDDQSYGMMACTGNDFVKTPNLDKLAADGVLFDNAYITSAICTPSRISMLLSQFERKHGVNFNSGTSVSEEAWENSYPVIMRNAGYYTGWIGKNHAPVGTGGYQSGIMEQSFDYWWAGHGHLSFYPKDKHDIFKDAISDTQLEVINEGVDDFLSENSRKLKGAIRFLEERPDDQPFLLSINLNLPHGNGTGSMKLKPEDDDIYKSLYRDVDLPLPLNYIAKSDIKQPKLPPYVLKAENRQVGYDYVNSPKSLRERYIRQLQAMTGIDRLVGNIREKLDDLNAADNTIIIFTSDHGLFMGEHGLGGKALCYEKTTHVPLIIFDPELPASMRGRRCHALVQSIDLAPTMLSKARIDIPVTFQGHDLTSLMTGQASHVREFVFTENLWSTTFGNPRCESVQDHEWKYIRYYKNENFPALKRKAVAEELGLAANQLLYGVHDNDIAVYREYIDSSIKGEEPVYEELYHLKNDPHESNNLIAIPDHSKIIRRLKTAWKKEINKARGTGNPKVKRFTVDSRAEFDKLNASNSKVNQVHNFRNSRATKEKPNIIIVLTDDQGWADVGFNGCTDIPTPNLDRIAKQGIVFSNGYVSHPYCSPSRAGLLTGRYQSRFGHDCNMPYKEDNDNSIGTPLSETLISEALKDVGYRTAAIGKWHIGDHPDLHPNHQGFDHWFGFPGGGMNYWGRPTVPSKTIYRNGKQVSENELSYLTDDFTDEALDFIGRDDDRPFFIYLAYNAPHGPDHATEEYLKSTAHIEYGGRSIYGAMVNAVDAGVGKIDKALTAKGIKDNTIIIFLSDNGGRGEHADNRPFRGHKGMIFEGGIKVPFFITYPKGLPGNISYKPMISSLDIFPTLLDLAGAKKPFAAKLDGVNLVPYLVGQNGGDPHEKLFWRSVGGFEYAVRSGHYKLYKSAYKEKILLFDLKNDPFEQNDIASSHPKLIEQLDHDYKIWDAKNMDPGWLDPHIENVLKEEKIFKAERKRATGNND